MAGPLSTNTRFDQFGYDQVKRDIEQLYLLLGERSSDLGAVPDLGGSTGSSLGLPVGVYDPAKIEVGPDGNILSITNAVISASRPSASGSAFFSQTMLSGSGVSSLVGTGYPFDAMRLAAVSFTSYNGFPVLSYTGTGSTCGITGFNSAKTYICTIVFTFTYGSGTANFNGVTGRSYIRTSSGGTAISNAYYANPAVANGANSFQHTHTCVFNSLSTLFSSIDVVIGLSAAANPTATLTTGTVSFIELT